MGESGQITVTTAGTAVQGPSSPIGTIFAVKAHPDNTDTVWVGNVNEDVSSANGFPLAAEEGLVLAVNRSLEDLWFDADVSGEKICWIALQ